MTEFTKDEWQLVRIEEPIGQVLGFICTDGMIADLADCVNAEANARLIAQSPAMFAVVKRNHAVLKNDIQYFEDGERVPDLTDMYSELAELEAIIASVEGSK